MATLEQVKAIVSTEFQNSDVTGLIEEHGRVFGTIVWPGFQDMPYDQRNKLVTDHVRDQLGYQGLNVGTLLALATANEL